MNTVRLAVATLLFLALPAAAPAATPELGTSTVGIGDTSISFTIGDSDSTSGSIGFAPER